MSRKLHTVLSIAGSDSGGGAGIQADLRAFTALGAFGTTAITCITAQNPDEVREVQAVAPEMIVLQIKTVCDYFSVDAVKTGMLYSSEIISAVADTLETTGLKNIVVDPVMIATSGVPLLLDDAIETLCDRLLPKATIITPNIPELEVLADMTIGSVDDMKAAAVKTGKRFGTAIAAKGGHLPNNESEIIDILFADNCVTEFTGPRLNVKHTHGTGCSFAATLAACLANGRQLSEAMPIAKSYVSRYINS